MHQLVSNSRWLKSPKWDLSLLTFSALLAFVPYLVFVLLGGDFDSVANQEGTTAYNARLVVNTVVLVLIGGPHMYATFTRTLMDPVTFSRKKRLYISTAILIPTVVISMAVMSYETYVWLLTIFFAMASLHALHQIIWISGAYDLKSGIKVSRFSKIVDYGVVFMSLYPLPVWYMTQGTLLIGPVNLKTNELILGYELIAYAVGAIFFVFLSLFLWKTIREIILGTVHWGKTLLILTSVLIMMCMPLFPNLDTAFQGINVWHSFQYLMLTWLAHSVIKHKTGRGGVIDFWKNLYAKAKNSSNSFLGIPKGIVVEASKTMQRVDKNSGWSSFYFFTLLMLPISPMIMIIMNHLLPDLHEGQPGADEVYQYMGILSILLMHYVHDGFLFTDHEDLVLESN